MPEHEHEIAVSHEGAFVRVSCACGWHVFHQIAADVHITEQQVLDA